MRFEALEYFTAAAEQGSFTAAARQQFVSQQGLSKAVAALERELGCRLFERDGARLRLTDAGRALVPHARQCLAARDDLAAAMRPFARAAGPLNRPAASPPVLHAAAFVADSLFSLLDRELTAAGLDDVAIIEHSYAEIMGELERGGTDAVFALCLPLDEARELARAPHVAFRPLFLTEIMLAGSSRFIRPGKGAFSLERVAELPVAYYNDAVLNWIVRDMFRDCPLENVITHASNLTRIANYLTAGKAVTFTDSLSVFLSQPDERLAYAPIEGAARFCMGFAHRSDEAPDAAAGAKLARGAAGLPPPSAAHQAHPAPPPPA